MDFNGDSLINYCEFDYLADFLKEELTFPKNSMNTDMAKKKKFYSIFRSHRNKVVGFTRRKNSRKMEREDWQVEINRGPKTFSSD